MSKFGEPWKCEQENKDVWLLGRSCEAYFDEVIILYETIDASLELVEFKEKDAKRIVACVNALEGIENPEEWVEQAKDANRISNTKEG